MRDALGAARDWGVRPSVMLLPNEPATADWSEADRYLSQSLSLHNQDLCPGGCGHYLDETEGEEGHWTVETVLCGACYARDEWQAQESNRKPGLLAFARRLLRGED